MFATVCKAVEIVLFMIEIQEKKGISVHFIYLRCINNIYIIQDIDDDNECTSYLGEYENSDKV